MVDSVDHIVCSKHAAAEVATVEALVGVLATLDAVEFDVDFAVVVVEGEVDVYDFAVLVLALSLDILLEFLGPVRTILSFPVRVLVC